MIIPDSKKSKDLDMFLKLLVGELKSLDRNIEAFDASASCIFLLKA